jgi:hypothetical protein
MESRIGSRSRTPHQGAKLLASRFSLPPRPAFPPQAETMGICAAAPRVAEGVPPFTGVAGNTALLLVYLADLNPDTTCPYNSTKKTPALIICTGVQIAPYLVLTSASCLAGENIQGIPGCAQSELADVFGECTATVAVALLHAVSSCCDMVTRHLHYPSTRTPDCTRDI